jgi:thiol-disulfide isomerase/thioredoxin
MRRTLILVLFLLVATSSLHAGEARLRALLHAFDDEGVIRTFETTPSASKAERAMYVLALFRSGAPGQAVREAEKLCADHPNDAWSWFAAATTAERGEEALPLVESMMAAAGDGADELMVRLRAQMLSNIGRREEAEALLDKHPPTPLLVTARAMVMQRQRKRGDVDPEAVALLERALVAHPNDVALLSALASLLREMSCDAEALALLDRAAPLTNGMRIHAERWALMKKVSPDKLPGEIEETLARGFSPSLLGSAAAMYRHELNDTARADELEERILGEAPLSVAAQKVLASRVYRASTTADKLARAREAVAFPMQYDGHLLAIAYRNLFLSLRETPDASDEEVLDAIRGMLPSAHRSPGDFKMMALTLADRGLALEEAERLAKLEKARVERHFALLRTHAVPNEKFEAVERAMAHDVHGWILFKRGRVAEAEKELLAAYKLHAQSSDITWHLGQLYESKKQLAKAEEMYRAGYFIEAIRNPNAGALKALYQRRFGSLAGFDESLKEAMSFDAQKRRKEILATRIARDAPPYALKTLDGKPASLAELKGKVTVVNFWAVWCRPCVEEMPDLQKLARKFANDDRVAIVTINVDPDPEKVRKWMAGQKYDFPVLRGDLKSIVVGLPTTWFLDRDGKIAFEKAGWSQRLFEEFTWRIEALR